MKRGRTERDLTPPNLIATAAPINKNKRFWIHPGLRHIPRRNYYRPKLCLPPTWPASESHWLPHYSSAKWLRWGVRPQLSATRQPPQQFRKLIIISIKSHKDIRSPSSPILPIRCSRGGKHRWTRQKSLCPSTASLDWSFQKIFICSYKNREYISKETKNISSKASNSSISAYTLRQLSLPRI